jgi:hypothetical protein
MSKHKKQRQLRTIAASFTVAAPAGARIRDRLRLTAADEEVLTEVGRHLGRHARADLAARIRLGQVAAKDTRRAVRKKTLTAVSSSRWAGAITRASEDQYRLSLRALYDDAAGLRRAIKKIRKRLAAPCGQRTKKVRGYTDQAERFHKQHRLAVLEARLARVEQRIEDGHPSIVIGSKRLAKMRHHLDAAQLTEAQWRQHWQARRMFLTADGESGAPFGNYTLTVNPHDGTVMILLPEPLRHLANAPRRRYKLSCTVTFSHRREEWADRAGANKAVRYDITYAPDRDRWYLDASWSTETAVLPTPVELAASGARLLGVDLNADHLAACIVDAHGNPVGQPITLAIDLSGPAAQRDGRLRAAIGELIALATEHGCAGIAIENLGFDDARATGRETMGRGSKGKRFRRTVAGIPTGKFRDRLRGMAYHHGLLVVAVDPAYTSRWGGQYWQKPLEKQSKTTPATGHHGAAVAIGRRGLGYRIRRRPGVPRSDQRIAARRATGQAVSVPRPRGTTSPPRTPGTPTRGGKTRVRHGDQLVLFPDLEDRSRGHPASPECSDMANTGQHR